MSTTPSDLTTPRKPRGFAALSPERRSEIASKGGVASRERGVGHRWTKAEAREAGRKGGLAARAKATPSVAPAAPESA